MTFRSAKSGGASAGNVNHTISWSGIGAVAGDTAVLALGWNFNGTALIGFSGWSIFVHPTGLSGNQLTVLTKTLTAGDISAGSQVFNFDSSTRLAWAVALFDSDIALGTPVQATGITSGSSVTTLNDNTEVFTAWVNAIASGTTGNTLSFANGTTDALGVTTVASGVQMAVAIGRVASAAPGSFSAGAVTNASTGAGTNQDVAFEISPADPGWGFLLLEDGTPLVLEDDTLLVKDTFSAQP